MSLPTTLGLLHLAAAVLALLAVAHVVRPDGGPAGRRPRDGPY